MIIGTYEIGDGKNIIAKGTNTITKIGRRLLGEMLSSTMFVESISISALNNNGTDTIVLGSDFQSLEVTNSYSVVDSVLNKLTVVFEAYGGVPTINNIQSIGLSTSNGDLNTMVTVSDQNNTDISTLTNIYVAYKIVLDI